MQGVGQPVSHCFPLNGRDDAMCEGLTGIKEAYRHALRHWKLAGWCAHDMHTDVLILARTYSTILLMHV